MITWWSYVLGVVCGIALTPVTFTVASWWWTRHQRRATGWEPRE